MAQHEQQGARDTARKKKVAAVLALASLVLFLALVFDDIGELANADWSNLPLGLITRYAVAMALGGAVAGYALSGLFGKSGAPGWALALFAGFLVSTLSGVLGSAFGLAPDLLSDGYQTSDLLAIGAGALVLPLAMVGWPILLPIWLALVATAHVLAGKRR